MEITIINIADIKNYEKKNWDQEGIILFSDEWELRKKQCQNLIKSKNKVYDQKIHGRKCLIKEISSIEGKTFLEEHHIQGSNNLGIVFFGLIYEEKIVGVMSLGRHNRQTLNNSIVLDRFCIANGIHISGGATKLFLKCKEWAKKRQYEEIISFSDNRWTDGNIYNIFGFSLDKNYKPDYCYIDPKCPIKRISKQSQKKSSSNCPDGMTEFEWAEIRGLKKLWDKGKKRWVYYLNPNALSSKEKLSAKCAEQNRKGDFKQSHIRGYYFSHKCQCEIYYGSSYELRCVYLLDKNEKIKFYKRADVFVDENGQSRSPDFHVEYTDNSIEIIEVKPEKRKEIAKIQIEESEKYAKKNNYKFSIWSEKDTKLESEYKIIKWAKEFIAISTGNTDWVKKQEESIKKKSKKHYENKIKKDLVKTYCEYCKKDHEVLRKTFEKNIKRNDGKYICEAYGGHIAGLKPKLHLIKENVFSIDGKKKCTKCLKISPFECFGQDKSRKDGYNNKCKECRAKFYRDKYQSRKDKRNAKNK